MEPDPPEAPPDPSHDWHLFDAELGMEVAREGGIVYVRYIDDPDPERRGKVTVLTPEEFEQLRAEGPNPRGLD